MLGNALTGSLAGKARRIGALRSEIFLDLILIVLNNKYKEQTTYTFVNILCACLMFRPSWLGHRSQGLAVVVNVTVASPWPPPQSCAYISISQKASSTHLTAHSPSKKKVTTQAPLSDTPETCCLGKTAVVREYLGVEVSTTTLQHAAQQIPLHHGLRWTGHAVNKARRILCHSSS